MRCCQNIQLNNVETIRKGFLLKTLDPQKTTSHGEHLWLVPLDWLNAFHILVFGIWFYSYQEHKNSQWLTQTNNRSFWNVLKNSWVLLYQKWMCLRVVSLRASRFQGFTSTNLDAKEGIATWAARWVCFHRWSMEGICGWRDVTEKGPSEFSWGGIFSKIIKTTCCQNFRRLVDENNNIHHLLLLVT